MQSNTGICHTQNTHKTHKMHTNIHFDFFFFFHFSFHECIDGPKGLDCYRYPKYTKCSLLFAEYQHSAFLPSFPVALILCRCALNCSLTSFNGIFHAIDCIMSHYEWKMVNFVNVVVFLCILSLLFGIGTFRYFYC